MPYYVEETDGQFCVFKEGATTPLECYDDVDAAERYFTALTIATADEAKAESDTHIPPEAVADNARMALEVRAEKPASEQGMTLVGLARARQLAERRPVSVATLRRMLSYFARHEVDKEGATWEEQGKGWQAWYGWGGDEGRDWAQAIIDEEDSMEAKAVHVEVTVHIDDDYEDATAEMEEGIAEVVDALDNTRTMKAEEGDVLDTVKTLPQSVKAIGDYMVQGKGIVYGGFDLTDDRFTKDTDLGESRPFEGMPVFYDHAMGGIKSQIGTVKAWVPSDEGIDVEIELDRRHKYAKEVMKLVDSGALGLSTGALSHLVVREPVKGGYEIKRWHVAEISLTPTPAEPRTVTEVKSEEGIVSSDADTLPKPDDRETIISKELDTMSDIKDAVKQAITELAGEPVQGGVIAAPATKTVTSRGFSNEPTEAFKHWIRTGDEVAAKATLVEGTNDNGGYLVPKDLYDMIVGRRDELSLLSQARFMRLTTSRRQIDVPAQDAKSDFAVVAEAGSANIDEPTFANTKTITIYNHSLAMKVSNELLRDQAANLEQFLTEEIGRAAARATNNAIIAGTGSSQPYGILARATVSETLATTTGVDFADIINIMGKLPSWYDEQGATAWIMRNATKYAIRALTGNYPQFRPLEAGGTGDLEGYPVLVSDKIAAMAASAKSIIFGNMSYYAFVENGSLEVSRNPYLYQENYLTGIFVNYRFGGDVTQPEAFVYGVHPAS